MKRFKAIERRWFLPFLAALSVVGVGAGYAVHAYAAGDDCCYEGSPCCHPGAACCVARHDAQRATSATKNTPGESPRRE